MNVQALFGRACKGHEGFAVFVFVVFFCYRLELSIVTVVEEAAASSTIVSLAGRHSPLGEVSQSCGFITLTKLASRNSVSNCR